MDSALGFVPSINAMGAERERMQVISSNIANARVVGRDGEPYVRKSVVFEEVMLDASAGKASGVRVAGVLEDQVTEHPEIYEPSHPGADERGYVRYPNVDVSRELVDLMIARRSYGANIAAFQAWRQMIRNAVSAIGTR